MEEDQVHRRYRPNAYGQAPRAKTPAADPHLGQRGQACAGAQEHSDLLDRTSSPRRMQSRARAESKSATGESDEQPSGLHASISARSSVAPAGGRAVTKPPAGTPTRMRPGPGLGGPAASRLRADSELRHLEPDVRDHCISCRPRGHGSGSSATLDAAGGGHHLRHGRLIHCSYCCGPNVIGPAELAEALARLREPWLRPQAPGRPTAWSSPLCHRAREAPAAAPTYRGPREEASLTVDSGIVRAQRGGGDGGARRVFGRQGRTTHTCVNDLAGLARCFPLWQKICGRSLGTYVCRIPGRVCCLQGRHRPHQAKRREPDALGIGCMTKRDEWWRWLRAEVCAGRDVQRAGRHCTRCRAREQEPV